MNVSLLVVTTSIRSVSVFLMPLALPHVTPDPNNEPQVRNCLLVLRHSQAHVANPVASKMQLVRGTILFTGACTPILFLVGRRCIKPLRVSASFNHPQEPTGVSDGFEGAEISGVLVLHLSIGETWQCTAPICLPFTLCLLRHWPSQSTSSFSLALIRWCCILRPPHRPLLRQWILKTQSL